MSDYQVFSPSVSSVGGQILPTVAAAAVYAGDARTIFCMDLAAQFYADAASAATVDNVMVITRAAGGRWLRVGSAGSMIYIGKQVVTLGQGAIQTVLFTGLNGDVDGEYYAEGAIKANAAGDLYLRPNDQIANTRHVITLLQYTGGGPTQTLGDGATPKLGFTPTAGSDFTNFRCRFVAARDATIPSRTARCESETTRGGLSYKNDSVVFWDEQVTNVTSLGFGGNATLPMGVGTTIRLYKIPLV